MIAHAWTAHLVMFHDCCSDRHAATATFTVPVTITSCPHAAYLGLYVASSPKCTSPLLARAKSHARPAVPSATMQLLLQVAANDDELAGKDEQLSASLREVAEVNEQYISELSVGQQQLESEVASLTAQLEAAADAAAVRVQQEADMQTAQKRLRGQVAASALVDSDRSVCTLLPPLASVSVGCRGGSKVLLSILQAIVLWHCATSAASHRV